MQDFDENGVDHIFYTQDQVFHNQQFEMFDQDIIFTEKEWVMNKILWGHGHEIKGKKGFFLIYSPNNNDI